VFRLRSALEALDDDHRPAAAGAWMPFGLRFCGSPFAGVAADAFDRVNRLCKGTGCAKVPALCKGTDCAKVPALLQAEFLVFTVKHKPLARDGTNL
jgi:hypothetical protein